MLFVRSRTAPSHFGIPRPAPLAPCFSGLCPPLVFLLRGYFFHLFSCACVWRICFSWPARLSFFFPSPLRFIVLCCFSDARGTSLRTIPHPNSRCASELFLLLHSSFGCHRLYHSFFNAFGSNETTTCSEFLLPSSWDSHDDGADDDEEEDDDDGERSGAGLL